MDADYSLTLVGKDVDKYPAKAHARRVADTMGVSTGVIYIPATRAENWPNSDMPRPFRQNRYFYYMTGCNESDCFVTYNLGEDKLTLWLPPINKARVVWTGRGSTVEEALQKYDIDAAHYINYGDVRRDGLQVTVPSVEKDLMLWKQAQGDDGAKIYSFDATFQQDGGDDWVGAMALQEAFDLCRMFKDEYEIRMLRRANEISGEAHTAVMRNLHRFSSEPEVEAQYMRVCIASRAKDQAYDPIVGAGTNASELHYMKNDEEFTDATQLLVIDAGCNVECYASDVTRTLPVNLHKPGYWPSKEAENTYKLVEKVQEACIKRMKPGGNYIEINKLAQSMIIDGLQDLGILKGTSEDIAEAGVVLAFLPHGLGHHMGLEVHDVSPPIPSSLQKIASSLVFEPSKHPAPRIERMLGGMVITVEPGVYFNRFLLENFFLNDPQKSRFIDEKVLSKYMGVGGVRIEDDILITNDGYENLTTAPKGERMLQIIRQGAQAESQR